MLHLDDFTLAKVQMVDYRDLAVSVVSGAFGVVGPDESFGAYGHTGFYPAGKEHVFVIEGHCVPQTELWILTTTIIPAIPSLVKPLVSENFPPWP